jgi:hypothetical protein
VAEKYYCYIDETWREVGQKNLIVGAVVIANDNGSIRSICEEVERWSGKGHAKWIKAGYNRKMSYIKRIISSPLFQGNLFYQYHAQDYSYVDAVTHTLEAILLRFDGKFTVLIDGLSRSQERQIALRVRRAGSHSIRKIRGVRDESEALIRLADALCGLIGMALDGNEECKILVEQGIKRGTLCEL